MDDDAFLRAVLERPDDDAPRLVYADWLEERGDPRGAFIRAQVELARLSEDDPRRPALEHCADELWAKSNETWKTPLSALLGRPVSGRFRRGFLESLTLSAGELLCHGESLWSAAPLSELEIEEAAPRAYELARLDVLTKIRALELVNQSLDLAGFEALLASPYLAGIESLDLSGCELHPEAARLIAQGGCPGLKSLNLSSAEDIGDTVALALSRSRRLEHLESLNLCGTIMTAQGARELARVPGLTSLNLSNNDLDTEAVSRLASGRVFSSLRELHLSNCSLGQAQIAQLAAAPLHQLRRLNLSRNSFRDTGAAALARSPNFGRLEVLDLSSNRLTAMGLEVLVKSGQFDGLRQLNLSLSHLTSAAARVLAAAEGLTTLRRLNLGTNALGDEGAVALAEAPWLMTMHRLELFNNGIGRRGFEALLSASDWPELRELNLSGNPLPGRALKLLAEHPGLPNLVLVAVSLTECDDRQLRRLRRRFHVRLDSIVG